MTCQEFGSIIRDYAQQQWLNANQRAAAQEHVADCEACRCRLQTELALETRFGGLAAMRREEPVPDSARQAAMEAFRRRTSARKPRWSWKPLWIAVPVAAALVLFGVALRWGGWKRPSPEPVASATVPERVTDFVPLRFGKPVEPGETLQVIRIQMRRGELMQFGVPVSPDMAATSVKADVVLGEDGLAKAIRLVY